MLIDERIKSENFRTQYQSLKEETTRLQDEFLQAQNEIRHLLSDKQTLQHQMKLQAADFQKSLLAKSKRLEELQQQTMSPLQQEMLKAQMQQEMDAPVREMRLQLEEEIEKYKAEYYKLRYECLRLQSQADQQREEHARALESQRLRYQAERKTMTETKERKLQNKVQLLEAKLETLELEVSAAKKTLSFCEQAHKRKLKDLLRRHGEFQRVLFEGGYSEAPGVVTSTAAFVSRAEELLANMPAEQHQDTSELWRRMEDLEHEQQQLKELKASAGPLTAPQQDL
eukprot:XP_011619781.1 PREDICTED: centrosomal protein of 83 kDa-like [Takifugu rubripes]